MTADRDAILVYHPPMLQELSREDRMLLLEFVCAFAWTDLEVTDAERRFVQRLASRLGLDAEEHKQVEHWLYVAPSPHAIDPARVPAAHRKDFIEAVRAMIYADGHVDTEERMRFEQLKAALA
jgi:uncharacterized tellurite resistance protein B-like protein